MKTCCGENEPIFMIQGGRFSEGGVYYACHSCIGTMIEWVWKHPRLKDQSPECIMVEVRPLEKSP